MLLYCGFTMLVKSSLLYFATDCFMCSLLCKIIRNNKRQGQFENPIIFPNRGYVPMWLCSFVHLNCFYVDPQ